VPGEANQEEHHKYLLYLSAALLSAKANAPSLEPHLIYSGEERAPEVTPATRQHQAA
jgi:hypothetical protein